jgi:hypothetical protein
MQNAVTRPSAQDLFGWAHKQFQNLISIPLSVHVYNLNFTPVDGGLKSLQHVGFHFILIESRIF